MTEQKAYAPFELKAVDEKARTFTGLASTWDVDLDGDVIEPTAFDRTLEHWKNSNGKRIIPLIDQHNYRSVRAVFGKLEEAKASEAGLETTFSIVKSGEGDEYLSRIKGGYLNGLSIGFQTIRAAPEDQEVDGEEVKVRVIKEVKLMEISAVIWGANPNALIDTAAVKALIRSASARELAPDELKELEGVYEEIGALLKAPEPEGIAPHSETAERMEATLQRIVMSRSVAI